jgi:hypothetical protein
MERRTFDLKESLETMKKDMEHMEGKKVEK